jgi:hypothetical protein
LARLPGASRPVDSSGAREEDARADGEAAGEAVGLIDDGGGDAEGLVAELEGIADVEIEAEEQVVADGDGGGRERGGEGERGGEIDLP